MPTDDERREIAAKLRDMACRMNPSWPALMDLLKCPGRAVAVQYLADLIEPEERTCHAVRIAVPFDPRDFPDDLVEVYQFRCSECSVLLEDDWSFCPNCGAKVVRE